MNAQAVETESRPRPAPSASQVRPQQRPRAVEGDGAPQRRAARPTPIRPAVPPSPIRDPWWFHSPAVFMGAAKVAFLPFALAIKVAELIMAAVVLGVVLLVAGWYLGWITDAQVVEVAVPVGERILSMVESMGGF